MKDTSYIRTYGSKPFFVEGANLYVGTESKKYYFSSAGAIDASNVNSVTGTISNLFVPGELRALQYNIQSINNLGGAFLIGPTINIPAGNNVDISSTTNNVITATINGSFSSGTFPTVIWAANSKIKISGSIGGVPIGTCDGKLTAAITTTKIQVQFTYDGQGAKPLSTGNSQASVDLAIMIYTVGATNPIGIYMTSWGDTAWTDSTARNKSSISIYGGTTSSDVAPTVSTPVVRIGNLSGLTDISGQEIKGWGIYSQHGYFKGTIAAEKGVIGSNTTVTNNWQIGDRSIWYGNKTPGASTSTLVISTGTASTNSIAGSGTSSKTWMLAAGTGFGVTNTGVLYATGATITGTIHATGGEFGSATGYHIAFDSSGLYVYQDANTKVASYGANIILGQETSSYIQISSTGLSLYRTSDNIIAHFGYGTTYNNYFSKTSDTSINTNKDYYLLIGSENMGNSGTKMIYSCVHNPNIDDINLYYEQHQSNGIYITLGSRTGIAGQYSCAEGYNVIASGYASHAEGIAVPAYNSTSGQSPIHIPARPTIAAGEASHAEGRGTHAYGAYAHSEGSKTLANDKCSHAEGFFTEANNAQAHAEGFFTKANGENSHTEGRYTKTIGNNSHASGNCTIAHGDDQTVIGRSNIEDSLGNYAFIIGNGQISTVGIVNDNDRSNALTVDWNGNGTFAGNLYANDISATVEQTSLSSLISVSSANATLIEGSGVRFGKIVQIYIKWKTKNAITVPVGGNITNVLVGTLLLDNLKPKILTAAKSNGDLGGGAAWYTIHPTGEVYLGAVWTSGAQRTVAAGTEFSIMATYIAK